jgi:sulfofructose kinase
MIKAIEQKSVNVVGIGQCALDYIGLIGTYPDPDTKCEFTGLLVQGGGPVATALVALQRWGVSCAFCGVAGDDEFGNLIIRDLEQEGINLSGMQIRKESVSQFAFSLAEPETGRRTIYWRRPSGAPLRPDEIDPELIRGARCLITDGLFPEAALAACETARNTGIPIVVDAGSPRPGMTEIMKLSNYFIASENFAGAFMPGKSIQSVCRNIAGQGPELAAVTLGEKGYAAYLNNKFIEEPAVQVKAVDTTGCGDIFHAGFVYGLLNAWQPERSLKFAAWAAAMVSRFAGGRTGIPDARDWTG